MSKLGELVERLKMAKEELGKFFEDECLHLTMIEQTNKVCEYAAKVIVPREENFVFAGYELFIEADIDEKSAFQLSQFENFCTIDFIVVGGNKRFVFYEEEDIYSFPVNIVEEMDLSIMTTENIEKMLILSRVKDAIEAFMENYM